jgi:hypothetical protein
MSESQSQKPVLISGAGLASLLLAQSLHNSHIPFRIFERDESLASRGQGYRLRLSSEGLDAIESVLTPSRWQKFWDTCGKTGGQGFSLLNAITGEPLEKKEEKKEEKREEKREEKEEKKNGAPGGEQGGAKPGAAGGEGGGAAGQPGGKGGESLGSRDGKIVGIARGESIHGRNRRTHILAEERARLRDDLRWCKSHLCRRNPIRRRLSSRWR